MGLRDWIRRRRDANQLKKAVDAGKTTSPTAQRIIEPSKKSGTTTRVFTPTPSPSGGGSSGGSGSSSGSGGSSSGSGSSGGSGSSSQSKSQADARQRELKRIADAKREEVKRKAQEDAKQKRESSEARRREQDIRNKQLIQSNLANKEQARISNERKKIISAGGKTTKMKLKDSKTGDDIVQNVTEVDKIVNGKLIKLKIIETRNLRTGETSIKTFDRGKITGGITERQITRKDLLEIKKSLHPRDKLLINKNTGQPIAIQSSVLGQTIPYNKKGIKFYNEQIQKFDSSLGIRIKEKVFGTTVKERLKKTVSKREELRSKLEIIQQDRGTKIAKIDKDRRDELKKAEKLTGKEKRLKIADINMNASKELDKIKGSLDVKGQELQSKVLLETGKGILLGTILTANEIGKLGLKAGKGAFNFGRDLVRKPQTRKNALKAIKNIPKYTYDVGKGAFNLGRKAAIKEERQKASNLVKTFVEPEIRAFGNLLKTSPAEAILVVGGEILLLNASGKAFRVANKATKATLKGTTKIAGKVVKKIPYLQAASRVVGKPVRFISKAGSDVITFSKATKSQVLKASKAGFKKGIVISKERAVKLAKQPFRKTRDFDIAFSKTIKRIEKLIGEKLTIREKQFIKNRIRESVKKTTLKNDVLKEIKSTLIKTKKTSRIQKILDSIKDQLKPGKKLGIIGKKIKLSKTKIASIKTKRIANEILKIAKNEKVNKSTIKKILEKNLGIKITQTELNKAIKELRKLREKVFAKPKKPTDKIRLSKAERKRMAKRRIERLKEKAKKAKEKREGFSLSKAEEIRISKRKKARLRRKKVTGKKPEFKLTPEERLRIAKRKKARLKRGKVIGKKSKIVFTKDERKRMLLRRISKNKEKIRQAKLEGKITKVKIKPLTQTEIAREIKVSKVFIEKEKEIAKILQDGLKNVKIQSTNKAKKIMRAKVRKLVEKVRPVFVINGEAVPTKKIFNAMKKSTDFNSFIEKKVIPSLKSTIQKSSSRVTAKATGRGSQQLIQIQKKIRKGSKFAKQRLLNKQAQLVKNAPKRIISRVSTISKNVKRLSVQPSLTVFALNKINSALGDINKFYSRDLVDSLSDSRIKIKLGEISKITSVEKISQADITRLTQAIAQAQKIAQKSRLRQSLKQTQVAEKKKKRIFIRRKKKKPKTRTLKKAVNTFYIQIKKFGKFKRVQTPPMILTDARSLFAYKLDKELQRTAKIIPAGKKKTIMVLPKEIKGYYEKNKSKFRPFKIKKGVKKGLIRSYIEKKKYVGDQRSEILALQLARRKNLKKKRIVKPSTKKGGNKKLIKKTQKKIKLKKSLKKKLKTKRKN